MKTAANRQKPCRCGAYPFPHRAGSGKCQADPYSAYPIGAHEHVWIDVPGVVGMQMCRYCEQNRFMVRVESISWEIEG